MIKEKQKLEAKEKYRKIVWKIKRTENVRVSFNGDVAICILGMLMIP